MRKTLARVENLDREAFKNVLKRNTEIVTLYISCGRKKKLGSGDILGALTGEVGGFSRSDIGKIEIHDLITYFAISKRLAPLALQRLLDGSVKRPKFQIEIVRWISLIAP